MHEWKTHRDKLSTIDPPGNWHFVVVRVWCTLNTTFLDLRKLSYLRRRENSKANVCGNSYIDKAALSWNSARNLRFVFFNKSFVRAWRMWLQVARCAWKCKKTASNHLVGWKCENLFPLLLLCIPQITFTHSYMYTLSTVMAMLESSYYKMILVSFLTQVLFPRMPQAFS